MNLWVVAINLSIALEISDALLDTSNSKELRIKRQMPNPQRELLIKNFSALDQFNVGGTKSTVRTINHLLGDEKMSSEIPNPLFFDSNNFRNGNLQLINFQRLK